MAFSEDPPSPCASSVGCFSVSGGREARAELCLALPADPTVGESPPPAPKAWGSLCWALVRRVPKAGWGPLSGVRSCV